MARDGTCSQWISQFHLHSHTFIRYDRVLACPEAADNDDDRSKEAKDRRSKATSTVYTVDATEKQPSMNGLLHVNYSGDRPSLSTSNNAGRQKKTAAAAAAWRRCSSTVQSDDTHGRSSSPRHPAAAVTAAADNRRPPNNECLRRSETSSPAEVIIGSL